MTRKQGPKPHPDWFWMMSGGVDSTATYLTSREALHDNFGKRPVMVYLDTGVGLPINRLYVERLADYFDEMLFDIRTNEHFEDWVEERGAPGGKDHTPVRNRLKMRQVSKLSTISDDALFVLGIRADESPARAKFGKFRQQDRSREIYPVYNLSRVDCARIILESGCPINPCWLYRSPSDCFCLSNGDPSELEFIKDKFPWFYQRMKEIEEAADAEGLRSMLGWDGVTKEDEMMEAVGSLCSSGCEREEDPFIRKAFEMKLEGSTTEEAIKILEIEDGRREQGLMGYG